MGSYSRNKYAPLENSDNKRREFLKKGLVLGAFTGISGGIIANDYSEEGGEKVSPSEDLMREHGLLNRILLIYDTCKQHILDNEQFEVALLNNSAQIIRSFIEDYHEKLEEDYLFPRYEKAYMLNGLVQVLRFQHKTGRLLTDQIIQFGKMKSMPDENGSQKLIKLLSDFNGMYRPHAAREDTVLFPVLRKVVSESEYFALGEYFEEREHELLGEDGFEGSVEKVAKIEKQLGIYELSQFTPQI